MVDREAGAAIPGALYRDFVLREPRFDTTIKKFFLLIEKLLQALDNIL